MGDFTGGFTGAINDAATRQAQDFTNRHLAQIIQQRMLEIAQQNEARQRATQARSNAGMVLPDIFAPPPGGAPGMAPAPQSPGPGVASVPMEQAPTGPPPMGAPGGMSVMPDLSTPPGAPAEPMAGAGPENSPSPGLSEPPAAPPAGWTPSPSASPELGGQPPGAPQAQQPASIGAPPTVPKMPPQLLSAPVLIQAMVKRGIPSDQIVDALHVMEPVINSENRYAIAQFKAENDATKAANAAYKAAIDKFKAENQGRNISSLVDTRAARVANQADANTIRREAIDARLTGGRRTSATAGAGPAAGLSGQGLDLAATEFARTGKLPSFSRDPVERRRIIDRAAELEAQAGRAPGETVTNRMDQKAVQQAYNAVTKDLAAIGPYNNMLETNGAVAKDLAAKAIASSAQLANKPINWLRQNATDSPAVATYLAQMRIFSTEAARVLNNPRLVGQLTDSARHEMEGIVNGDMPLNATIGVIDRLTQDGKIRVGSMEDQASFLKDRLAGKKGATSPAARTSTGAPAASAGPKRISGDAEYDALPKGATFVGPDGKVRVKP